MATKRKKKPVPQHEGRMLKGYGDDGVHYGEQIERDLDDAGVRAMGEKAFVFALGTEGSLCNQPAWRELRNAAQAALRSTAPEGEEGCAR